MEGSSLLFMTCDELRDHFAKCHGDDNKRILLIDVRSPTLFEKSHLCLDTRNSNSSTVRKMRVLNIDPDLVKTCTAKKIMSDILKEPDHIRVFSIRRDATEVVIIDSNTDDISKISDPRSKIMRIINALTKFDSQVEDKITVPIHILKGGYREWLAKYPHFTTNSAFDADANENDFIKSSPLKPITPNNNHISQPNNTITTIIPTQPIHPNSPMNPNSTALSAPKNHMLLPAKPSPSSPQVPDKVSRPAISKPVPTPPRAVPSAPKPNIVKNAPGTAVPVTPILSIRPTLSRSHSSPNVAQADGDELDDSPPQFDKLNISSNYHATVNINNNHIVTQRLPRIDRTLKPSLNYESINLIRTQLNFGSSPEASGKAITGLKNLGNTCFMNSVIQCLAYAPPLVIYFCSDKYYSHINFNSQYGSKGHLAIEFGALVERLNSHRHKHIEPKSFQEAIIRHIGFEENKQQDSHEFMMMLFDKLHHDLNTKAKERLKQNGVVTDSTDTNGDSNRAVLGYKFWEKHLALNESIISQTFEGIFMSTLTCTYCKEQSNTFEVFNCLSLPIPSETRCHLRDCLSHFSNPERIEAAWECPKCKQKREAEKKIVICRLPRILIIHLKRFSLTSDGRWRQKLQTAVDFPLSDLSVDCTNVLPQSVNGFKAPRSSYNLMAVVNHYGHLDGGHYTAFCKLENQRWYEFDDGKVSAKEDTKVCGQEAYILFYSANF